MALSQLINRIGVQGSNPLAGAAAMFAPMVDQLPQNYFDALGLYYKGEKQRRDAIQFADSGGKPPKQTQPGGPSSARPQGGPQARPMGMNRGGTIAGQGPRDNTPVMVGPGERILPARQNALLNMALSILPQPISAMLAPNRFIAPGPRPYALPMQGGGTILPQGNPAGMQGQDLMGILSMLLGGGMGTGGIPRSGLVGANALTPSTASPQTQGMDPLMLMSLLQLLGGGR